MAISKIIFPLIVFSVAIDPAMARLQQYQADLTSSDWVLTKESPLVCKMEHQIPLLGRASFESKAGVSNLQMKLEFLRTPSISSKAKLFAVPPIYKAGKSPSYIADVNVVAGFDTSFNQQQSWAALIELEQGNNPTLYFNKGAYAGNNVEVMLNSANFGSGYDEFLTCVGQLLPYGYADVEQTVLNYQSNTDELDLESLRRLHRLVDYLYYDQAITKISIGAYSDSYGGRWHNSELSKTRANAIKKFMQEAGINPELVVAVGHGESKHIASNEDQLGRAQNRRVVIQLTRDESFDEKMKLPSNRRLYNERVKQKVMEVKSTESKELAKS